MGVIFTRDNLYHGLAAIPLTLLIGPLGTTLLFWARENAQAVAKDDPDAWRFWKWSPHRQGEWLVPATMAWTVTLVRALPIW